MRRARFYGRQQGISIVLVLFLLTVVAVMVVSMANLSSGQHMGSLYSFRGAQAYLAARAGVDHAISRINSGAGCAGVAASLTIVGHNVTINCALTGSFNEGNPVSYDVFNITATASRGGFQVSDVATREVRATIKNP
jgi:MSHA biogenesis protein MshP